eukprot:GHVN01012754.1.p1 GENE.GHVN01012754.1~~GHVN01012754.1.p1  ORF type:complete len:344 (+),score=48.69 GHVN01012754.1:43-1032(+)
MLRRNARLRKEYLFRKTLEEKEVAVSDRKRQLQEAVDQHKSVPTELKKGRQDAKQRRKLDLVDVTRTAPSSHIDDEYGNAGSREPKILVTTSRDPSARLLRFIKELKLLFPTAQRVNRGQYRVNDLAHLCRTNDVTDMIMVHEHRGKPDGLVISHFPYGPTVSFSITDVVMRHDLPERPDNMSEAPPHLVFHNFTSKLGTRVMTVLKHLFPPAKAETNRVITFANSHDLIHFRNHTWSNAKADTKPLATDSEKGQEGEGQGAQAHNNIKSNTVPKSVEDVKLAEIGPRMTLKLYKIELGTAEMTDLEVEWALRPFFNSQKSALESTEVA